MTFVFATVIFAVAACCAGADEVPRWEVPRIPGDFQVDGVLAEPQYREAFRWKGFVEIEPAVNAPTQWSTELYVFSNDRGLVIGLVCFDPRPEEIKRERFRRDEVLGAEGVFLSLDATGEAKQAVWLMVTPTNDVGDGLVDLAAGTTSSSFDFLFRHATGLTEQGWQAEIFIPYSSLSFRPGAKSQMLLMVQRYVPRADLHVINALPYDRASDDPRNGQAVLVVDAQGVRAARRWHLIPAWVGSRLREEGSLNRTSSTGSLGLTAEWQPRQDTVVKGTWRPDFSQVEADDTYQKINNRYPVFIREKRPFFLEGAESFATPLRLFYSRKIVQPEWGLRLSHRGQRLGLFGVLAQEENVPAGRFGLSGNDRRTTWAVFRGTLAVDTAGSFLGATATQRDFGGVSANRVFAIDAVKQGERLTGTLQAAISRTGENGRNLQGTAFWLNANYRWNENLKTGVFADRVSPDFRADAGFVVNTDRQRLRVQQEFTYFPKEKVGFFRSVEAAAAFSTERTTGGHLKWEGFAGYLSATLPHQVSVFVNPSVGREGFGGREFGGLWSVAVATQWREHKAFQPFLNLSRGREVVYAADPYAGASESLELGFSSARGAWSLFVLRGDYRFGDGARRQNSLQADVTYVFSETWSAKVFFVEEELRFSDGPWATHSRFLNALVAYRVNPFSAVYLGANLVLEREGGIPVGDQDRLRQQQVFLKISWYL